MVDATLVENSEEIKEVEPLKDMKEETEEEEIDPEYVYGVTVFALPNGQGTRIIAINDPKIVERQATADDIIMGLYHAQKSLDARIVASQTVQAMSQFKEMRRAMGKVTLVQ